MQRYCAAVESKRNICPAGRAREGGGGGALKMTLPIMIACMPRVRLRPICSSSLSSFLVSILISRRVNREHRPMQHPHNPAPSHNHHLPLGGGDPGC